jgi:hypothetical protein
LHHNVTGETWEDSKFSLMSPETGLDLIVTRNCGEAIFYF